MLGSYISTGLLTVTASRSDTEEDSWITSCQGPVEQESKRYKLCLVHDSIFWEVGLGEDQKKENVLQK